MDDNTRAWDITWDATFDPAAITVLKEGHMEELKSHCIHLAEAIMFSAAGIAKGEEFTHVPALEYRKSKDWEDLKAATRLPAWAQGKTEMEIDAMATRFMRVLKLKAKSNG